MIHVNRGATSLGQFSDTEVREGLRSGRFVGTDLGWQEGMPSWKQLSQFSEFAADIPASSPAAASPTVPPSQAGPPSIPPATVTGRRTEPLAIWSLVLSLFSLACCGFVLGIPGIICGHLALSKMQRDPQLEGRGMAMAGLVIGYAAIALWLMYVVFFGGSSFLRSLGH